MDTAVLSSHIKDIRSQLDQLIEFYKSLPQDQAPRIGELVNVTFSYAKEVLAFEHYVFPTIVQALQNQAGDSQVNIIDAVEGSA